VQDGDQEMRKVGGPFIHLQPADNAMIRQILGDAALSNSQMLGKFRLDGFPAASRGAATRHIGNSYAQSLTSFNVIIRGQVGVGENPYARACGRAIGIIEFCRSTRQQPAKIHFELRKPRS